MAAVALSGGAHAAEVTWINPSTIESRWETPGNWSSGALPGTGDAVTIGLGNSGLYTNATVGTVDIDAGILWINRNGVLNADTITVNGGQLALIFGNLAAPTNPGPQGTANVSTLLNITGGTVDRAGLIQLGAAGTVTQSGGSVLKPVQIATPSYEQSDGTMTGTILGSGAGATMTQTGGVMAGTAKGIANYAQAGGTLSGVVRFTEQFELSGNGEIVWAAWLLGTSTSVVEQSGGMMGGKVDAGVMNDGIGIAKYTQTGGDMAKGWVTTAIYEAKGGSVSGTVDFSERFALSGDAVVNDYLITGDGNAAMTQSGDSVMDGWVSGISTYAMSGGTLQGDIAYAETFELSGGTVTADGYVDGRGSASVTQSGGTMGGEVFGVIDYVQSGGSMTKFVATDDYALSGGSVSGQVNFIDQFALSGSGEVLGGAILSGQGSASQMTQSGGTMSGHVNAITIYTQSDGTMDGQVDAGSYAQSGGTLSGEANFGEQFALSGTGDVTSAGKLVGDGSATATQSGGTMAGTVTGVTGYTQSGGAMSGKVTATTYTMSAGTLTGEAAGFSSFLLSGGQDVVVSGTLVGASGSIVTQTGGQMNGTVSGLTDYLQGGRVGPTAAISFSRLYALSGGFQLDAGAQIIGAAGSVMTQSSGKMEGTVTGITSYTQTGGKMTGSVSTGSYSLSADEVKGSVTFSNSFSLSGTGLVTGSGSLVGGTGSTLVQTGGGMRGTVTGLASYTQSAGDIGYVSAGVAIGKVETATYDLTGGSVAGQVDFSSSFGLGGTGAVTSTARLNGGSGSTVTQAAGSMAGTVTGVASYTQSGGSMAGTVTTGSYQLSGGTLSGDVTFSTLFALSGTGSVGSSARLTQTGGSMGSTLSTIDTYTQSGGTMTGSVTTRVYDHAGGSVNGTINVATYSLGASATSSSSTIITASSAFNLGVDSGTATIDARLSGAGSVVKSGASTVVLANAANDFSGSVAVDGGILEVKDSALPGEASVTVADGATLRFNTGTNVDTQFDGIITGDTGVLEKTGAGTLTLTGDIELGALLVNGGRLNIGNGAPEEASFDSAYVGEGATVYVASGATLRIRIPKNIANFGRLINDGTVYDDLDNAGWFQNNALYVANLASNTHDIHNNSRWEGNVLTNNGWIFNNDDATWVGDIVSNGPLDPNGRPGRIANGGGTWQGDILSNAGHIINDNIVDESDIGYWIGDIYSNTNWIFNGGGGDWDGDVISNAGLVMNGKPAVWHGDVRSNSEWVWNGGVWNGKVVTNAGTVHNAGGTWKGDVEANTGFIRNIAGIDAHGSTGGSTWQGDVVTNAGRILNAADSTWTGDVLSNTGKIETLGTWTGDFSNAGTVEAENQIVGSFTNSGTLRLTGDLSGITALSSSGVLDMKGGGAQTLSVASASLTSASFLDLQVDPEGNADLIAVAGNATLAGTLRISNGGAPHTTGPFTIVTANSVSGEFDEVIMDLAFFAGVVSYDTNAVSVAIKRNKVGFDEIGATSNQIAVGGAVEMLGVDNPIYDAVLWLTPEEAQAAFDQLSGETHASHASAVMEGANSSRQIATDRVEQAFAALGDIGTEPRPGHSALWGQFYGARGVVDAGDGTAGVGSSNSGVVLGLDGLLGDWRLGLMLQGGATDTHVATLNSSASSMDYGVGLYGGRKFGDTLLSFGASHTRHDNNTTREVSFPDFTETLSANYASATSQVFANVSHTIDLDVVTLKPYAGLAYVSHATDGFTESGGAAALGSEANAIDATFASLGLGVEQQFVVGEGMLLTASGSVGWRHAFAATPISVHQFGTGPNFSVTGKPAPTDMMTLGAGLDFDVGGGTNLDLTYAGQIGGGTQTHALQGTWSQRF